MCKMIDYLLFASCFSNFGACVNNPFGMIILSLPVFVLQKFVVISCTTRSELRTQKTSMDNFTVIFSPQTTICRPLKLVRQFNTQILYASSFLSFQMNT